VIIHDLNVLGALFCPPKAHAKFVIHANAVLSSAIAFQGFQPVSWRYAEVIKSGSAVKHCQLSHRNCFDIDEAPNPCAIEQTLRISARE
jgi:hypothetical protein